MRKLGCLGLLLVLAGGVALFLAIQGWGGAGPATSDADRRRAAGREPRLRRRGAGEGGRDPSAQRFRLLARVFGGGRADQGGRISPARRDQPGRRPRAAAGRARRFQRCVDGARGLCRRCWSTSADDGADGLTGTGRRCRRRDRSCPTATPSSAATRAQAVVARMQKAMTRLSRRRLGEAEAGHRGEDAARGDHPRLDRREGNRQARRSGGWSRRSIRNRLRRGMPLQADPTVIYPITKGRPLGRRILRSELQAKNGYNTYAMPGLPVGPIANPGRASIDAVLDPATVASAVFRRRRDGRACVRRHAGRSTTPMCRNGMRSGGRGGRCERRLTAGG